MADDMAFNPGGVKFNAHLLTEGKETAGVLSVGSDGVAFQRPNGWSFESAFREPWSQVADIDIDGAEALQSRVTVTRLILVGIFAFALKKKTGDVYAYIQTKAGFHLVRVPKKSAPELRAVFAPYRMRFGSPASDALGAGPDFIPCPLCGAPVWPTSIKCMACGRVIEVR